MYGRRCGMGDGVNKQTIYDWKAKYGGMNASEVQRLRLLKDENSRIRTYPKLEQVLVLS